MVTARGGTVGGIIFHLAIGFTEGPVNAVNRVVILLGSDPCMEFGNACLNITGMKHESK